MPLQFLPSTSSSGETVWGDITGTIADQTDLQNALDGKAAANHASDTNNPHSVTKSQLGLSNVTDDAQLKRAAADINSFTSKSNPVANDLLLIEDSENSYNKKKISIGSLPASSSEGKIKVSSNDTSSDYLTNKITVSDGIKKQDLNDGSDEDLNISLDIHGTSQTIALAGNDEILVYDASNSANKRATIDDVFLRTWADLDGTCLNSSSFTFSGTTAERKTIEGSLFTCTNSDGTVKKVGFINSTTGDSGTCTAVVTTLTALSSGDKDFKVAPNRKFWDYAHLISIPGEVVADADNPQGLWLLDVPYLAWLLALDIKLRTAASGTGASCQVNLYRNSTQIFSNAVDLGTMDAERDIIPNYGTYPGSINQYDSVSMRIIGVGGSVKPQDLQARTYIVPQNIFEAK